MQDGSDTQKRQTSLRAIDRAHLIVDWVFGHIAGASLVIGGLANIASGVLFVLASIPKFRDSWVLLVVLGGIGLIISFGTSFVVDRERRKSEAGKTAEGTALQLAMTDAFQPILRRLSEMQTRPSDMRPGLLLKAVGAALQTLPTLFPAAPDARMVVYKVEQRQGRRKRLAVEDSAGRQRDHAKAFVSGDNGRGDAVFAWLEQGGSRFVPNIDKEDDPNWKGSGRGYTTFISAPIVVDDYAYGMLTVDAPNPGDLDETDVAIVDVLAGLLATGYACAGR